MVEYELYVEKSTVKLRFLKTDLSVQAFIADNGVGVYVSFDAGMYNNTVIIPDMKPVRGGARACRTETSYSCISERAAKCMRTKIQNALNAAGGVNLYKPPAPSFWDK
jgi:hypothetical protein